ncbi:MAG: FMN-binding protein [Lentisphaeria bacterium]|nr:FMN-binding protein [Lentisphaeria bacterium]
MIEIIKLGCTLALTCALAGGVLAFANVKTAAPIEKAAGKKMEENLCRVLPPFQNSPGKEKQSFDGVVFYPARDAQGTLLAVAAEGATMSGFGGLLKVLVSLDPASGKILAVIVTSHKETPGLGTKAVDRKSVRSLWHPSVDPAAGSLPPNECLDRFTDRLIADTGDPAFHVVKSASEVNKHSVQAISGATVSSSAVADAVKHVCAVYEKNRSALSK